MRLVLAHPQFDPNIMGTAERSNACLTSVCPTLAPRTTTESSVIALHRTLPPLPELFSFASREVALRVGDAFFSASIFEGDGEPESSLLPEQLTVPV